VSFFGPLQQQKLFAAHPHTIRGDDRTQVPNNGELVPGIILPLPVNELSGLGITNERAYRARPAFKFESHSPSVLQLPRRWHEIRGGWQCQLGF
jgi:hypothetical protein